MDKTQFKNNPWHWLVLIGVLIISVIAGGYWYDQHQIQLVRNAKFQELRAVSRLKISQISDWRNEVLFDAQVYAQSPLFSESVVRLLKRPGNIDLKNKILDGWNLIRINDGFDNVILAGPDGNVKLSLESNCGSLSPYEQKLVKNTISAQRALFSDFFRCPVNGAIHIDVMAPIPGNSGRPVAVLVLRIDPKNDLYPLLDFWPTSSESSETYILSKERGEFVLLNKLRSAPQREVFKKLPLSQMTKQNIEIMLNDEGLFEGQDSRGVNVVACISRVPETGWIMITQVDKSEILADARYHSHLIGIMVLLLILVTAVGSGFIHRRQRTKIYKKLYRTEKERNDILEEFRITLYSIGDGVISMDETGRIRHMNPVAERLTGWSESEARDKPLREVLHIINEKTGKNLESPDDRVIQKEGIVKLPADALLIARDGTKHPIADSAAPINKEKDKLAGIVVVFSDVTVEREAQQALLRSEERYRNFFMDDITGDFISTPDGKLLDCNLAFAHILGFESVDEAKQHHTADFYSDPAARDEFLKILYREKRIKNYEIEMRRVDGKPVYIIENVIGKFDKNGNLVELRGYLFDITERKKLERQFLQAQKMEAVGRLAGGVAHDFNNMLGVIQGYCEILLLKESKPSTSLYDKLMEIKKAAQRSADLTRQLLAFARKQIVEPKVLDINDSVESMLKLLRRLIGEDVDLAWKPGSDIWKVKMDPSQIDQILANLLINARDAIDDAGNVTIETDNVIFDQAYCDNHLGFIPGDYVLISVSDDGCGMEEDTLGKIFEPFFTTKEKGKGTGLGLATVYGVVKQNNGFINVYSEPGKGTKISIYIPRFSNEKIEAFQKGLKPVDVKGGNETILLVEDEVQILNMSRQMLEDLGYTVLSINNPLSALRMVETYSGHIDLLITDVVLPEMTGRDLVKNLSAIKPGLKCIYMSGYTANAIAHQGVLEEGINFLQKPFSREQLAIKIRDVLDS